MVSYTYDTWGKHDGKAELKDENGNVIQQGDIKGTLASTVGVKNPYRYRAYRFDTETGLYYLNSRYYNPEWGRFINADATIGKVGELLSNNMFVYCKNNPINLVDPSGHWPSWGDIFDSGKRMVNTIVESVKQTVLTISFIATATVIFCVKNPDIVQAATLRTVSKVSSGIKANYSGKVKAGNGGRPANFSPNGAGRNGAFREAKRASGIPMSEQPIHVASPASDLRGNTIPGRDYYFSGGKTIHEHFEHVYPDNPIQNRGTHFNDVHGNHYDYFIKE